MNSTLRSSSFRLFASFALLLAACGGGGGDAAPSGGSGAAGSGSQNPDGKACTGPADCPSGYACTTVAMAAWVPSAMCSLMQCDELCAGDPQCIGECLMSECPGPGGPGAGGSSPGAGGSSSSGACGSLCAKVGASCGAAEGSACQAACPSMPPACVSCLSSAPDVCNPDVACSAACGTGPSGAGGAGGGSKNVCKPNGGTAGSGTAGSGTAGSGTAGSGPAPFAWAGTWIADVQYEVACDVGAGNIKKAKQSHAVTTTLSGSNGSLTAAPGSGYEMSGLGNEGSLTLNGTFPFRDCGGETASGTVVKDNQGSIKINSVTSDKAAMGSIEGTFVGKFGAKCTVSGGSVSLSR